MLAICDAGKKLTTVVHAFYVDGVPIYIYVCTASIGASDSGPFHLLISYQSQSSSSVIRETMEEVLVLRHVGPTMDGPITSRPFRLNSLLLYIPQYKLGIL